LITQSPLLEVTRKAFKRCAALAGKACGNGVEEGSVDGDDDARLGGEMAFFERRVYRVAFAFLTTFILGYPFGQYLIIIVMTCDPAHLRCEAQ
jgi:hypothetical protein